MASASKIRTRHSSQTKLAEYLGPGKPLIPSQLPTLTKTKTPRYLKSTLGTDTKTPQYVKSTLETDFETPQ